MLRRKAVWLSCSGMDNGCSRWRRSSRWRSHSIRVVRRGQPHSCRVRGGCGAGRRAAWHMLHPALAAQAAAIVFPDAPTGADGCALVAKRPGVVYYLMGTGDTFSLSDIEQLGRRHEVSASIVLAVARGVQGEDRSWMYRVKLSERAVARAGLLANRSSLPLPSPARGPPPLRGGGSGEMTCTSPGRAQTDRGRPTFAGFRRIADALPSTYFPHSRTWQQDR
jgi:hypothetical protein